VAVLVGASLTDATLRECDFSGANLSEAFLMRTNAHVSTKGVPNRFVGAKLADVIGSELLAHQADFSKADFTGAIMDSSDFLKANLSGATCKGADLSDASLLDCNLEGAVLDEANLQNADLRRANLARAHIHDATMTDAKLDGANFNEADVKVEW